MTTSSEIDYSMDVQVKAEEDSPQYVFENSPTSNSHLVDRNPSECLLPVALIYTGVTESESSSNTVGEILQVKNSSTDYKIDSQEQVLCKEEAASSGEESEPDIEPLEEVSSCSYPTGDLSMFLEVYEEGRNVSEHLEEKHIQATFIDKKYKNVGGAKIKKDETEEASMCYSDRSRISKKVLTGLKIKSRTCVEANEGTIQQTKRQIKAKKTKLRKPEKQSHLKSATLKQTALTSKRVKRVRNGKKIRKVQLSKTFDTGIFHTVGTKGSNAIKQKGKNYCKQKIVFEGDDCEDKYTSYTDESDNVEELFKGNKCELEPESNVKKEVHVTKSGVETDRSRKKRKFKPEEFINGVTDSSKKDNKCKKIVKCEYCVDVFPNRPSLNEHWTLCHGDENPFKCSLCSKGFPSEREMRRHKYHEYAKSPAKLGQFFACQYCKSIFKKKSNLVAHERKHTGEKPYVCEECGKAFTLLNSLKRHREVHVTKDQLGSYSCHVCGKTFGIEAKLKRHLAVHKEDRSQPCEICGKVFASKVSLSWHLKIHMDIRKYKCEHCGARFCKGNRLKCHLTNEKNRGRLTCQFCGYLNPCSGTVKSHLTTHEEYCLKHKLACTYCGLRFVKKRDLVRHTLSHLEKNDFPFSCEYCDKSYTRRDSLVDHLKKAHHHQKGALGRDVARQTMSSEKYRELLDSNQRSLQEISTEPVTAAPTTITQDSSHLIEEITVLPDLKNEVKKENEHRDIRE